MRKILIFLITIFLYGALPSWYYEIKDINKQKQAFIKIMLPLIREENQNIIILRRKIINIFKDPYFLLRLDELLFLAKIADKYKIKSFNKKEFLKKVDIIPPSLILAQAAIESGWGKSRFAKVANNFFGHWTYSKNGISPKDKFDDINITYSIRKFKSIRASLKAYMLNLNRNLAYKEFRELRYKFRLLNKPFTGLVASQTMHNYSKLKNKYIQILKKVIIYNNLEKFDKGEE